MNAFKTIAAAMLLGLNAPLYSAPPATPDEVADDAAIIRGIRLIQKLQIEIQRQQQEIEKIAAGSQVASQLLRDMANAGLKNPRMMELLNKNGYGVSPQPTDGAPQKGYPATASLKFPPTTYEAPASQADTSHLPADMKADVDYLVGLREANLKRIKNGNIAVFQYETLKTLIVELSTTDPDAKALVVKYQLTSPAK